MTSNYSAGAPLVSVLLPVYNGSSSIGETIESALCQTYRNIELIVVDDGSTDQTNALVQQYADRDPRVKIIRQENRGVAAARNRGLAAARGEFVAPLDADDLWEPTKIELQVRRILEAGPETGLIYCWWVWIDGEGVVLDRSPSWRVEGDGLEMLLRVNYTGNASVPLIRRTCLEEVGGYDETLRSRGGPGCEDWDAALRVAERYKVSVVPELLVGYRRRAYSMSTNLTGMWKSQTLVTGGLHHRRGDLSPDLFRQSKEQFSLYLAGVSFWHGDYFRACTYAAGAWRSRVLYRLFPYAVQSLWRRLIRSRQSPPRRMAPGISLDSSTLPQPLIPYDRIYGAERTENSPGPVRDFAERLLQSRRWQSFTVILAFCMIAALHADNDGLWFQGDAPRHATNGLFWWDLLWALPSDPEAFTLQYYARYPVISPLTYPPLFYLLEGLAFKSFGASPQVAKFLILCFAVLAGLYTMEWSRRWIGVRAGWAGAFLAFVPGVVLWTNAVMLNMPAMALGLACLYHCRWWMESGARKQLVLAAAFLMAVLLTYFQGGCVFAICILWAALFRRNHSLMQRGLTPVLAACGVTIGPFVVALIVAPVQTLRHLPSLEAIASLKTWTMYPAMLPELLGPVLLVLGLAGLAAGVLAERWRTDSAYIASWILVVLLCFSLLPAKSSRYILLVTPAFVIAAAAALAWLFGSLPRLPSEWRLAALAASLAAGLASASHMPVPEALGFRQVAAYLEKHAAADTVLYDGYYDGLFGFYVRASDPRFDRRIVLGTTLLYQIGPTTDFRWVENLKAASVEEVVEILRERSGCKWVAIEAGSKSEWSRGQQLLRQAVKRPEFELVLSFPIHAENAHRIDLYRFTGPVMPVSTIDLSFPSYSDKVFRSIEAIKP